MIFGAFWLIEGREASREIAGEYAANGKIIGDLYERLETINGPIDLVISNGESATFNIIKQYRMLTEKLSEHAILLSDHSQYSDKRLEFSIQKDRRSLFFQEKMADPWPSQGAGIGISDKKAG